MIEYTTNGVKIDRSVYDETTLHVRYIDSLSNILRIYAESENVRDMEPCTISLIAKTQKALTDCAIYKLSPKFSRMEEDELTLTEVVDKEIRIILEYADMLMSLAGYRRNHLICEIGDVLTILAETVHMRLLSAIKHQQKQTTKEEQDLLRSLRRMESRVEGFMNHIGAIESLLNLSDKIEQSTTFFNKMVDDLADRLKQAFNSINS